VPAKDKTVFVYATFPSADVAEEIGSMLVDTRLAACVNIIPQMTSIYVWQGARQRDAEAAMIIKTREHLVDDVVGAISQRHPYDTPAIAVLPVVGGSPAFLAWIAAQTGPQSPR
jgi:periplasmic divalent cation tolerance protein